MNKNIFIIILIIIIVVLLLNLKSHESFTTNPNSSVEYKEHLNSITGLYKNVYLYNNDFYFVGDNKELKSVGLDSKYDVGFIPTLLSNDEFNKKYAHLKVEHKKGLYVYTYPSWRGNPGHALFDTLYPIFIALCAFNKQTKKFYYILCEENDACLINPKTSKPYCQSDEFMPVFSGEKEHYYIDKKVEKQDKPIFKNFEKNKLYHFDELISGFQFMGQRTFTKILNLPGNIEYNGVKKFVERFYNKYKLGKHNPKNDSKLNIIVIENRRYEDKDIEMFKKIIDELNKKDYIHAEYLEFKNYPTFEDQIKKISNTDIYISGPGSGLMLHPFMRPNSIIINLGSIDKRKSSNKYPLYMEQYLSESCQYLKVFYYSGKKLIKDGWTTDELMKLVKAGIKYKKENNFTFKSTQNLSPEGKIFVELCKLNKPKCLLMLNDLNNNKNENCIVNAWVEPIIYGIEGWNKKGIINLDTGNPEKCTVNHDTLNSLKKDTQNNIYDYRNNRNNKN